MRIVQDKLVTVKFSIHHTSVEVVKIGCELSTDSVLHEALLQQGQYCVREAQAAREATDGKLMENSIASNDLAELCKW